jgi:P27 family predicted phage terminase small subunit
LKGPARSLWRRLAPKLYDLGLLTELDLETFATLCDAWKEYIELERSIKSPTVTTDKGNVVMNPIVSVRNQAWKRFVDMASRFGLSPSDRNHVRAVERPTPKAVHEFFQDSA